LTQGKQRSPKFKNLEPLILFPINGGNVVHVAKVPYDVVLEAANVEPVWRNGKASLAGENYHTVEHLVEFINEHFGTVGKRSATDQTGRKK